jgi:hypothetical protein
MAAVEKIIGALEARKIKEAVDGLSRPLSKDAYELGRLSGIQQGLAIATQIINEAIGEDEQSQSTASRSRKG